MFNLDKIIREDINMENIILSLRQEQVVGKTICEIYDVIALQLNVKIYEVTYDCRKLLVSLKIQESIFEAYRNKFKEEYLEAPQYVNEQISVNWILAGPKVADHLLDYQVEILPGFICY